MMINVLVYPLLSAVLCAVSIPNEVFKLGLWPLGFLSLIPLYLSLRDAPSFRLAALSGAIFGAVHHGLTSYWLFFYRGFAFWTLGSTIIAYACIYSIAAMYGFFALRHERAAYRPVLFALGWTTLEFFKSIGFLGYPWGLQPYSLTALPLMLQTADIAGVYGLSFVLSYVSASIASAIAPAPPASAVPESGIRLSPRPALRNVVFAAFLLSLVALYGVFALNRDIPITSTFRATMVQQNTDPWLLGEMTALESNVSLAAKAARDAADAQKEPADIVIFSETSLRRPYAEYRSWFDAKPSPYTLNRLLADGGVPLLTGAPIILDWKEYTATNSALLISPEGSVVESYAKMHPVPFAEAIPFWEYAWFRNFMQNVVGLESGWVMGVDPTIFRFTPRSTGNVVSFSVPICFEDAFADLCRRFFNYGADLLINLTNDSWSRTESAQLQHWAIARFRSIENRRTLLRSTNSGVSCIVDAWGRNSVEFPQFVGTASVVDVPIYRPATPTLYSRFGDWFALFCVILFCCRMVILCVRFLKGGEPERRSTTVLRRGAS